MSYTRLSFIEREEISRQVCLGLSIRTVANTINRSPSTVSREINANVAYREYYRAVHGQQRAKYIRRKKRRMRRLDQNHELRAIVMQYIFKNGRRNKLPTGLKSCILRTWICTSPMKPSTHIYRHRQRRIAAQSYLGIAKKTHPPANKETRWTNQTRRCARVLKHRGTPKRSRR